MTAPHNIWRTVVAAGAMALSSGAHADAPPFPGALRCEFESHTSAVAEKPDKSIRATVRAEPGIDPLIYTAFDAANGSAQLICNIGASRVTLIATGITWSFVEVTDAGNINVTQAFLFEEPDAQFGLYRAIHSRHSSFAGAIVASQHYGHCKALN
jgi:hypothetical protein